MKTSLKLTVSFLLIGVLTVAVGVIGIVGMSSMNRADDTLYNMNLLAIAAMADIRENVQQQRSATLSLVLYADNQASWQSAADSLSQLETNMQTNFAAYEATIEDDSQESAYHDARQVYDGDFAAFKANIRTLSQQDAAAANSAFDGDTYNNMITTMTNDFNTSDNNNSGWAKDQVDANSALANSMTIILLAAMLAAVALAVFLTLYISRLIGNPVAFMREVLAKIGGKGDIAFSEEEYRRMETQAAARDEVGESFGALLTTVRHLNEVGGALETVANGDLSAEVELLSPEDAMGLSLRKMVQELNKMFGEIGASSEQVASGSKQIADGAQSLAQGSTEQAAAVEQLSASIAEIAHKTLENADQAQKAASLAGVIKQNAEAGSQQMDQMIEAVRAIGEASQGIGKVIKVIDDIAFQTNILALNAAVEAARAGQHGKGFAVVAEEVRSLAAKSAEAAKDTGSLIANSIEKSELGSRIAAETAASLTGIVSGINESTEIVSEIARASEEQSLGIDQINRGIDQVAQVVQHNSATAEESAAASEEMSSQSNMLEELVSQFKLKNEAGRRNVRVG